MKLHEIFAELESTPGSLDKLAILKKNQGNLALKNAFRLAYNPQTNFYITVDKSEHLDSGTKYLTEDILLDVEQKLNGREVTGNAAREYLYTVLSKLTKEDQIILKRIINRDLECGASLGSAEKTWKGLIPSFPVMLADKFNDKTALPFYKAQTKPGAKKNIAVQLKCDGGRAAAMIETGLVSLFTRNGNEVTVHNRFDFLAKYEGYVIDGEILSVGKDGKFRDRKTSNGIYNKAVRGTISKEEAATLHFVVWDMIPLADFRKGKSNIPYRDRFANVTEVVADSSAKNKEAISLVASKEIDTIDEAMDFYADRLREGEEGAMLKLLDAPWEDRRSKAVLKLKEIKDATLLCVGVKPHSKNPNLIGSLECITSCGLLEVSIGTGLSGEDRERDPEYFLDKLIDMKYNQLILGRDSTIYSMFLPVYRSIREDVAEADTLEKLK